jgi:hypothetical protein
MKKKNHIIFGFLLSFIFILLFGFLKFDIFYFDLKNLLILCCIIIFYSLLADIDHKGSTIIWFFLGLGLIGLVAGIFILLTNTENINGLVILFFSTLFLIMTFLFPRLFSHRGIIHTIWVGLLALIPLWFVFHNSGYCVIAYVSWYSHLLGDGFIFKIK